MSRTIRVAVVGAGVAGSFLAFLLSGVEGFEVDVYEPYVVYGKPCGEAVPTDTIFTLSVHGVDVKRQPIRAMVVCVRGVACRTIDFGCTVGFAIDKHGLVKTLRQHAWRGANVRWRRGFPRIDLLLQEYDLVVDARGPYSDAPEYDSIVAVQGYVDDLDLFGFTGNKDTIHFWFDTRIMGYMWAFPSVHEYGEWNIGLGMRAEDYRRYYKHIGLRELLETWFDKEPTVARASKIKVVDPKHAVNNNLVRIGEAGGFLVPFTGEGIRPALESAEELFEDLLTWRDTGEPCFNSLRELAKTYKKHHKIYKLLKLLGPKRASKILLKADAETFERLLNGRFLDLLKLLV